MGLNLIPAQTGNELLTTTIRTKPEENHTFKITQILLPSVLVFYTVRSILEIFAYLLFSHKVPSNGFESYQLFPFNIFQLNPWRDIIRDDNQSLINEKFGQLTNQIKLIVLKKGKSPEGGHSLL